LNELGQAIIGPGVQLQLLVPVNRILTQKVKLGTAILMQRDVLRAERRGAYGISLVGLLFIAYAETQSIDEVTGHGHHAAPGIAILQTLIDPLADIVKLGFQLQGLVELASLAILLYRSRVAQPDVLELACELVLPTRNPHGLGLPNDLLPALTEVGFVWTIVQGNVRAARTLLPAPSQGVLTSSHKDTTRLHHVGGQLNPFSIDDRIPIAGLELFGLALALGGLRFAPFWRQCLPLAPSLVHHGIVGREIDFFEGERWLDPQRSTQILHKVAHKHRILHIGCVLLCSPGQSHLFLFRSQLDAQPTSYDI